MCIIRGIRDVGIEGAGVGVVGDTCDMSCRPVVSPKVKAIVKEKHKGQ